MKHDSTPPPDFNPSRRGFLRGKFRETAKPAETAQVGAPQSIRFLPNCLALQGVLCRTCSDRCDEGAIQFQPQIGGMFIPVLKDEKCTGCGDCIPDCPTQAVQLNPVVEAIPVTPQTG